MLFQASGVAILRWLAFLFPHHSFRKPTFLHKTWSVPNGDSGQTTFCIVESGVHEVIVVIHKMLSREDDLKEAEIGNGAVGFH